LSVAKGIVVFVYVDGQPNPPLGGGASVLHVPMDRLDDGAWLYAPLGGMLVVAGGERVVCHACGDALAAITRHHVRRHGLDLGGYRERFGLNRKQSLIAPALAEVRREEGRRRWEANAGVRDGLAVGQAMAKSGELHDIGVAAQPAGSRRQQGRLPASREQAAPALAAHRAGRAAAARARWDAKARALGFSDLDAYLADRRAAGASPNRVRTELGLGGNTAKDLVAGRGEPAPALGKDVGRRG
jgi:hypothetical protein